MVFRVDSFVGCLLNNRPFRHRLLAELKPVSTVNFRVSTMQGVKIRLDGDGQWRRYRLVVIGDVPLWAKASAYTPPGLAIASECFQRGSLAHYYEMHVRGLYRGSLPGAEHRLCMLD